LVFLDPFILFEDPSVGGEFREATTGQSEGLKLAFVVQIVLEDEEIRINSARQATSRERRDYENNA